MNIFTPTDFYVGIGNSNPDQLSVIVEGVQHNIKDFNGIFLAGPCIRENHYNLFQNWRDTAIEILKKYNFQGDVFSPEPFCKAGYDNQIIWEEIYLTQAKVIMFWIPRELNIQPAFTSNIEFGEWMKSGKVILGYPHNAVKMEYLYMKAYRHKIKTTHTLEDTVKESIAQFNRFMAKKGKN